MSPSPLSLSCSCGSGVFVTSRVLSCRIISALAKNPIPLYRPHICHIITSPFTSLESNPRLLIPSPWNYVGAGHCTTGTGGFLTTSRGTLTHLVGQITRTFFRADGGTVLMRQRRGRVFAHPLPCTHLCINEYLELFRGAVRTPTVAFDRRQGESRLLAPFYEGYNIIWCYG